MSRAKRNLGETHEPLPPLTAEERVAFEAQWAAWEAEVAATPSRKARVLSWAANALLVLLAWPLAALGYLLAQEAATLAGVGVLLMQVGFLVALPFMGIVWAWRWIKRRSGAAG
jgi:hypothetical protein